MSSAKVTIAQQDRSAIITSLSGISIGTVVNSKWGPTEPYNVTSPTKLVNVFAKPDNSKGSSWNGAELLLANSNSVWITRAIHEDARYSALLVAGTVEGVDYNDYPKPNEKPDTIVKSVSGGLGLNEINSYTFPTYVRDREFVNTSIRVLNEYNNEKTIEVSGFEFDDGEDVELLGEGDYISFAEQPNDESDIYQITKAEKVTAREDVLVLDVNLTGEKDAEVKKWITPVLISSTLPNVKVSITTPVEFTTTINSNENTYDDVSFVFSCSDPTAVAKFEYYQNDSWVQLEETKISDIGDLKTSEENKTSSTIAGYAISGLAIDGLIRSATIELKLRVTFNRASSYTVRQILALQNNTTISEAQYKVNVAESGTGTTGSVLNEPANGAVSYSPAVYLIDAANNANSIKVTDSDAIHNGDLIFIDGNQSSKAKVSKKEYLIRDAYELTFATEISEVDDGAVIQWMKYGDTEQRDLFLVYAKYPGDYGNRIKVGIRHSKDYENAFIIDEYFDGVLQNSYEVTRTKRLDGFGYQMYIEDKINGVSDYIMVKNNESIDGNLIPPETNYAVWRQINDDIFSESEYQLIEDVITNDTEVALNKTEGLSLGDRFKFGPSGQYEYKVLEISGNIVTLDRKVEEIGTIDLGTKLYLFNPDLNDPEKGIFNGSQYYKFTELDPLTNYKIGDQYIISGKIGIVLDAGYNNTLGGFDGSTVTLYDVITAFQKMASVEKYNISVFCDNGFAYPEVAIAIDQICQTRNASHGFLSTSYDSEQKSDAVSAMIEYRNSTNLNTAFSSIFGGWIKVSDTYNQTNVWVAPSVFGVNAQSFVTRNYNTFTPSAGWVYGVLSGLDITNKFDEGERDRLVDAQINPIRYREGYGLAIWGNETLYSSPSPLQLRSVAMLLIVLKYGLQDYLEKVLFRFNNEPTWSEVEGAIDIFIRDELYTPGGLYDYQVSVKDIITDTDIDNRKMPVWIGIQPTMDIKTIPVTIGIFNKSVNISY